MIEVLINTVVGVLVEYLVNVELVDFDWTDAGQCMLITYTVNARESFQPLRRISQ